MAGRGYANTVQQEGPGHTKIYEKHCADSVLSRGVLGVAACPPNPQMQHNGDLHVDKFVVRTFWAVACKVCAAGVCPKSGACGH